MAGQESDILMIFLTSAALMLFLAIMIILFVVLYQRRVMQQRIRMQAMETEHQQDLLRSVLLTQENERQRIAKDLHDDIGAVLAAAKLNVDLLSRRMKKNTLKQDDFGDLTGSIVGAIQRVRRISHELMPPTLAQDDLARALKNFCENMEKSSGIALTLEITGTTFLIEAEKRLGLYRMVQELTNNSLKHAYCKQIRLILNYNPSDLELVFEDDGKGFDFEAARQARNSLGLKSLESRGGAIGAKMNYATAPGKGTKVSIKLDLRRDTTARK